LNCLKIIKLQFHDFYYDGRLGELTCIAHAVIPVMPSMHTPVGSRRSAVRDVNPNFVQSV
jgi:hypothetical protein